MNYKEWSRQYIAQSMQLNIHLSSLKKQLKDNNTVDAKDLNYRISLIYPMYLELKHTGQYLKSCERRETNV